MVLVTNEQCSMLSIQQIICITYARQIKRGDQHLLRNLNTVAPSDVVLRFVQYVVTHISCKHGSNVVHQSFAAEANMPATGKSSPLHSSDTAAKFSWLRSSSCDAQMRETDGREM